MQAKGWSTTLEIVYALLRCLTGQETLPFEDTPDLGNMAEYIDDYFNNRERLERASYSEFRYE